MDFSLLLPLSGTWALPIAPHHLTLVLLWLLGELVLPELDLGSPATCMSDLSSQAIQELTSAVQARTLAISGSPPANSSSSADSSPGEWEVIGSESQDVRIGRDPTCSGLKFRIAEDGPGEIPPLLLDIARSKLTAKPSGAEFRARRAFAAGFFLGRVAIETETVYRPAEPVPECKIQHWFFLACPAFSGAARFTTRTDLGRAVEGDLKNSVYEAFASQTKVEIFCAGASAPLPALRTWRKPESSSSRRGIPASSSGSRR